MLNKISTSSLTFKVMASIAILFGLLTIKSGGMVLFTTGEAHQAAGNYVPFVLWFNFIAGFVYVITGIGLWLKKSWATSFALVLAILTVSTFMLFGLLILSGTEYETRTIGAMVLRSFIWVSIASITYNAKKPETGH